jgi:hypothetical protein
MQMLAIYAGDEYGCLSSWFLDECQVHELTRDHNDHMGLDDGDDNSSLGSASVESLGSAKSPQAKAGDKAGMGAATGRFVSSSSSSATPTTHTTDSSSTSSAVQFKSKALKFAGGGVQAMADTTRKGLSPHGRPSQSRVRVADDVIMGPASARSRGSQLSLGSGAATKNQSSYYSNRIRKVSKRYTQKG